MATQEELSIFQKHLQQRPLVCPICASRQWQLVEIAAYPINRVVGIDQPGNVRKAMLQVFKTQATMRKKSIFGVGNSAIGKEQDAFPVAIVTCQQCYFVAQFSWLPILERWGL